MAVIRRVTVQEVDGWIDRLYTVASQHGQTGRDSPASSIYPLHSPNHVRPIKRVARTSCQLLKDPFQMGRSHR